MGETATIVDYDAEIRRLETAYKKLDETPVRPGVTDHATICGLAEIEDEIARLRYAKQQARIDKIIDRPAKKVEPPPPPAAPAPVRAAYPKMIVDGDEFADHSIVDFASMKIFMGVLVEKFARVDERALAAETELTAAKTRIAELEARPTGAWRGSFVHGMKYACGDLVTFGAALWSSEQITTDVPGTTKSWTMSQRKFELAIPAYRGVFEAGKTYERGSIITFQGSAWHANEITREKPGESQKWTLMVKRGRDGRDAR